MRGTRLVSFHCKRLLCFILWLKKWPIMIKTMLMRLGDESSLMTQISFLMVGKSFEWRFTDLKWPIFYRRYKMKYKRRSLTVPKNSTGDSSGQIKTNWFLFFQSQICIWMAFQDRHFSETLPDDQFNDLRIMTAKHCKQKIILWAWPEDWIESIM